MEYSILFYSSGTYSHALFDGNMNFDGLNQANK